MHPELGTHPCLSMSPDTATGHSHIGVGFAIACGGEDEEKSCFGSPRTALPLYGLKPAQF